MEFIDQKGKLLGIINIIDLIVLFFFLMAAFTSYKYVYKENYPKDVLYEIVHPKQVWVTVTAEYNAPEIVFLAVQPEDEMRRPNYVENNVTIVRVIDIIPSNTSIAGLSQSDGMRFFIITFDAYVEEKPDGYYFESNRIKIGDTFNFNTMQYTLEQGLILNITMRPQDE